MANQYTKTKINKKIVNEYKTTDISLEKLSKKYNISRKIITRWINESKITIIRKERLKL